MIRLPRQVLARVRSERGSSAVELAVLAPAFLMVCMLIIQFGLWFNARQVALAAAQAGARVAREDAAMTPGWPAEATAAASGYYTSINSHLLGSLTPSTVDTTQGGVRVVGVTVTGPLGYSVFNWFGVKWTVSVTVTGPVECFHPAAEGGACG